MLTRRAFLRQTTTAAAALGFFPTLRGAENSSTLASFFIVGDTHFRAADEDHSQLDERSSAYNHGLIDWLNKLPGTEFSTEAGGGAVPVPSGVIHAGDLVDSGNATGAKAKMAETELAAFTAEWGVNGSEGRLKWQVREVHGNHDGPRGETIVVDEIKRRNQRRAGLASVSPNGLHYSWDWNGVHCVALGIVVGGAPEVTRQRRYAALDSLAFLKQDLAEHVGKSGKPVVLVHHVDVARYCEAVPDEKVTSQEWDYADVHAYYEALREYRVAAAICGHTHARNLFRWNGTKKPQLQGGVPFLNTDNAAHFAGPAQAFLHVSITGAQIEVREFGTKDGWKTGTWTPQVWKFDLA
jgi:predicted phosphodiesterase